MGEAFEKNNKESLKRIGDVVLDYEIYELRALKDAEIASAGGDKTFQKRIEAIRAYAEGAEREPGSMEYSGWVQEDFKKLIEKLAKEGILEN